MGPSSSCVPTHPSPVAAAPPLAACFAARMSPHHLRCSTVQSLFERAFLNVVWQRGPSSGLGLLPLALTRHRCSLCGRLGARSVTARWPARRLLIATASSYDLRPRARIPLSLVPRFRLFGAGPLSRTPDRGHLGARGGSRRCRWPCAKRTALQIGMPGSPSSSPCSSPAGPGSARFLPPGVRGHGRRRDRDRGRDRQRRDRGRRRGGGRYSV